LLWYVRRGGCHRGKWMTRALEWSETKLAELSTPELKNLLKNAHSPTRRTSDSPVRKREAELASEMGELAAELSKPYDLSRETAKSLSRGTKHFQAHKPVSADGTAKMGGLQRTRQCLINRYISYRLRDTVISLDIWLPQGASADEIEYHVFAPRELLPDAVGRDVLRPTLPDIGSAPLSWTGKKFASFEEAKACFAGLISRVAPKRQD